jgi:protein TonB
MASLGIVVLLHVVLGYAFISGLAYNVVKNVAKDLKTFDVVEEAPPPEEEPPPPPPDQPQPEPPPFVPPQVVQTQVALPPPPMTQSPSPITLPPPPQPQAPPKPSVASVAKERGNSANWVTTEDYPSRALREEREGVTGIAFDILPDGKVGNCRITSTSGSPDLDEATCRNFTRRARYTPAKDAAGNAIASTGSRRVRWQIPEN